MRTFFILSLPRSRTAWIANYLTFGDSYCFHEGLIGCRDAKDLERKFLDTGRDIVGNSDCGNVFFLDEIVETFPETRLVIIRRPIKEVLKDLETVGPEFCNTEAVYHCQNLLDRAEEDYRALVMDYNELDENGCRKLYEYCTGQPFEHRRWKMLDGLIVQIDGKKKMDELRSTKLNELRT